jgi:hypothetical protein
LDSIGVLVVLLATLAACTTQTVITTKPRAAEVFVDGVPVALTTPHLLVTRRSYLARGGANLEVYANGHLPVEMRLEHVGDVECVARALETSLSRVAVLLPLVSLFYLPWCSRFEQGGYYIVLIAVEPAGVSTSKRARRTPTSTSPRSAKPARA